MAIGFLCTFGGVLGVLYPYASNEWNAIRQWEMITTYETNLKTQELDYLSVWEEAFSYNERLRQPVQLQAFDSDGDEAYHSFLNPGQDGVMGWIEIPKINVTLSIYHGTMEEVLTTGVGHVYGSSLPVGGESTHAVLAGHRGLMGARLFTDLDQMEVGDRFYVHVLDEVHTYEISEIYPMVDKDDAGFLSEILDVQDGKDLVTLFTCTPYGINSHRLLLRSERVPDADMVSDASDTAYGRQTRPEYKYLILTAAVVLLMALILLIQFFRWVFRKRKTIPVLKPDTEVPAWKQWLQEQRK